MFLSCLCLTAASACDVCGCSAGGNYFGVLPNFKKNYLGMRFYQRSFQTLHPPTIIESLKGTSSNENFNTSEIWGRYYVTPKIMAMAFLPFNSFSIVENKTNTISKVKGLGDVMVMANYIVFETIDSSAKNWKHNLLLGGGIKLPTGNFVSEKQDEILNPNLQCGTGSLDYIINGNYAAKYKNIGFSLESSFRINNQNNSQFQFGNRTTNSAKFFYWMAKKRVSLVPSAGIIHEVANKDRHNKIQQKYSGGQATYTAFGADLYWRNIFVACNFQSPVHQNISQGFVTSNNRYLISINYILK